MLVREVDRAMDTLGLSVRPVLVAAGGTLLFAALAFCIASEVPAWLAHRGLWPSRPRATGPAGALFAQDRNDDLRERGRRRRRRRRQGGHRRVTGGQVVDPRRVNELAAGNRLEFRDFGVFEVKQRDQHANYYEHGILTNQIFSVFNQSLVHRQIVSNPFDERKRGLKELVSVEVLG